MWLERREGVVGNLRAGGGDRCDQRGLSNVRESHERNIGHQLQFEVAPQLLTMLALFGEPRSSTGVGEELCVAVSALAAFGDAVALAVVGEVDDLFAFKRGDHGANRHLDETVVPGGSMSLLPHSVNARSGATMGVVTEAEERSDVAISDQPDIATTTTITAIGTTFRHMALSAERHAACTAVTRLGMELRAIDEGGHTLSLRPGELRNEELFANDGVDGEDAVSPGDLPGAISTNGDADHTTGQGSGTFEVGHGVVVGLQGFGDSHERVGTGERDRVQGHPATQSDVARARDGIAVRTGCRISEEGDESLLNISRDHVFPPACFSMRFVPLQPDHVDEQPLGEAVSSHHRGGKAGSGGRQRNGAPAAENEPVVLEPVEHLRH